MPSEFENAMKSAAASLAKYIEDAAELQVKSYYVEIGTDGTADFEGANPVASTTIRLDGDSETVFPMRKNQAGVLDVDSSLFELHQENVNTAIEYRARILNAMLGSLMPRRS